MQKKAIKNLINSGFFEDKRIFTTNVLYKRFLRPGKEKSAFKPVGLWYSIEGRWLDWCIGEDFGGIGKYVYEVELNPKANILFLTTKKEVFSFSKKYKRRDMFYRNSYKVLKEFASVFIDWKKVAEDYDGIEVNPYFHELRFTHNLIWYYGWDVPSGCIWKTRAKKKVTLIAEYKARKKEFVIL